jgi:excisionase family DNA binding protein
LKAGPKRPAKTNRPPIGASAPTGDAAGEDGLTRLVKAIARQAAREAFNEFIASLERPMGPAQAASDPSISQRKEIELTGRQADPPPEPEERFLSIAAVAEKLDVSQKWVRRKIESGELPAHQVGKLLRVGERGLASFLAGARMRRSEPRR